MYLLRVFCRYYIALQIFSYAFAKILKTQFNLGFSSTIDENVNSFNGLMLTWHYYGYSRTYGLVIAGVQIASALLLLFRKTERIGVILFLSIMVNILLINYFYEIDGAKPMSIRLTIMGFFLLFSDWKALTNFFLKSTSKECIIPELIPAKMKVLYWLKFIIIPSMILYGYIHINNLKEEYMVKNELFGVWEITPRNAKTKIDKLYIEFNNSIKVRDTSDNFYYGKIELDDKNKKLKFKVKHYSDRAYNFIQDSLKKLTIKEENLKETKSNIREYYNSRKNTLPVELSFNYELKNDSLILIGKRKNTYLNITHKYKN